MMSPLRTLLKIMSDGVDEIETAYAIKGIPFPSLDEPFLPNPIEDELKGTSDIIASAAFQLITMVRAPAMIATDVAAAVSNCLI
jgi:hypothetical protein